MNALRTFESALSIMAAAESMQVRADTLTIENSAFRSFDELINAIDYRPSLSRATPDCRELGALYDATQLARGDGRRAFMYGTPARKGSIIDRANWDASESWYRLDDRITWWDQYTRQWIAYTICDMGYQQGDAEYYPNSRTLLEAEEGSW